MKLEFCDAPFSSRHISYLWMNFCSYITKPHSHMCIIQIYYTISARKCPNNKWKTLTSVCLLRRTTTKQHQYIKQSHIIINNNVDSNNATNNEGAEVTMEEQQQPCNCNVCEWKSYEFIAYLLLHTLFSLFCLSTYGCRWVTRELMWCVQCSMCLGNGMPASWTNHVTTHSTSPHILVLLFYIYI